MELQPEYIEHLKALNQIAETLNRAVDVNGALDSAVSHLVELMGLETGWVFLTDPLATNRWFGRGYQLGAHHSLPPALTLDQDAWDGGCDCQGLCNSNKLTEAYNEVQCSRLRTADGDKRGLRVHASAPLKTSRGEVLGILNVAGPNWEAFSPEALMLLTNVGCQIATALERARLYDLLHDRREAEHVALLAFSSRLLGQSDLPSLMNSLVTEVCNLIKVDAAALLVSSPESGKLVFTTSCGWKNDPVASGRAVDADRSTIPGLVMQTQKPVLVPDFLTETAIPWTNDWLADEAFRGMAVVPLVANGSSLGALVMITHEPRQWTEDDVRFLNIMANQTAIAIEKARLYQAELRRQRLEEELAIGRQIQLSLLPAGRPIVPGWQFAAFYQAAQQVGGDFYDFFDLPSKRMGMVIADIAGKGVPAALYMGMSRTIIRTTALSGASPSAALLRSNELLLKDSRADVFLTVGLAALDTASGDLTYSSAGHNWPLWYHAATKHVSELKARGTVLGVFPQIKIEEIHLKLEPDDVLLLYTDGITEAMNAHYEEFGDERLSAALYSNATRSADEIVIEVVEAVRRFIHNNPQSDDLTLLVIKRGQA